MPSPTLFLCLPPKICITKGGFYPKVAEHTCIRMDGGMHVETADDGTIILVKQVGTVGVASLLSVVDVFLQLPTAAAVIGASTAKMVMGGAGSKSSATAAAAAGSGSGERTTNKKEVAPTILTKLFDAAATVGTTPIPTNRGAVNNSSSSTSRGKAKGRRKATKQAASTAANGGKQSRKKRPTPSGRSKELQEPLSAASAAAFHTATDVVANTAFLLDLVPLPPAPLLPPPPPPVSPAPAPLTLTAFQQYAGVPGISGEHADHAYGVAPLDEASTGMGRRFNASPRNQNSVHTATPTSIIKEVEPVAASREHKKAKERRGDQGLVAAVDNVPKVVSRPPKVKTAAAMQLTALKDPADGSNLADVGGLQPIDWLSWHRIKDSVNSAVRIPTLDAETLRSYAKAAQTQSRAYDAHPGLGLTKGAHIHSRIRTIDVAASQAANVHAVNATVDADAQAQTHSHSQAQAHVQARLRVPHGGGGATVPLVSSRNKRIGVLSQKMKEVRDTEQQILNPKLNPAQLNKWGQDDFARQAEACSQDPAALVGHYIALYWEHDNYWYVYIDVVTCCPFFLEKEKMSISRGY